MKFADLLFLSSEESTTRFCPLRGGGPAEYGGCLRGSYLVMLVPQWPQNMRLILLIFDFDTQLCSMHSLVRHRSSLYQAVPQSRQCKDFSSRPRVREDAPKDQWPWSRTGSDCYWKAWDLKPLQLHPFHPFSLSAILCTGSKSHKLKPSNVIRTKIPQYGK